MCATGIHSGGRGRAITSITALIGLALGGPSCGGGGAASGARAEATLTAAFPASAPWIGSAAVLERLPDTALAVLVVRDLGRLHALLGTTDGGGEHGTLVGEYLDEHFHVSLTSPAMVQADGVAMDAPVALALLPHGLIVIAMPVADEDAFATAYEQLGERVMLHGKTAIMVAADDVDDTVDVEAAIDAALAVAPERSLARAAELTAVIAQLQHAPDAVVYLPQRGLRELVLGDVAEGEAARSLYDGGYGDEDSDGYGGEMYGGYDEPSDETLERWRGDWRRWGVPLGGVAIGVGWADEGVITVEATGSIDDRGIGWATAKGVAMGAEALLALATRRDEPVGPPADVESATAAEAKAAAAKAAAAHPDDKAALRKRLSVATLGGTPKVIWAPGALRGRHPLAARLVASGAPLAVHQLEPTELSSPFQEIVKALMSDEGEEVKALRKKRDAILEARSAQEKQIVRGLGVFVAAGSASDGVPRLRGGLFFDGATRTELAKLMLHSWSRDLPDSAENERLAELEGEISELTYDSYGYGYGDGDGDEGYYDSDYWGEEGGVEGGVVGGVIGGVVGGYDTTGDGGTASGGVLGIGGGSAAPRYTAVPGVINIEGADTPSTVRAAVLSAIADVETTCAAGAAPISLSIAMVVDGGREEVTIKPRGTSTAADADAVKACITQAFVDQIDGAVERGAVKIKLSLELKR